MVFHHWTACQYVRCIRSDSLNRIGYSSSFHSLPNVCDDSPRRARSFQHTNTAMIFSQCQICVPLDVQASSSVITPYPACQHLRSTHHFRHRFHSRTRRCFYAASLTSSRTSKSSPSRSGDQGTADRWSETRLSETCMTSS